MRLAACAAALVAAGCATLPHPGPPGDWPDRRTALQAIERWTLDGRMAVAAGSDGFSGGLSWRQDGERADIELRGPLGGRALAIQVAGETISVTDSQGVTVTGTEARRLLAAQVGTDLPVAQLRYWLVGVPAPGLAHRESLGADRRLAALDQSGWRVAYSAYRDAGSIALPSRLEIRNDDLRLRLSVADWRLDP